MQRGDLIRWNETICFLDRLTGGRWIAQAPGESRRGSPNLSPLSAWTPTAGREEPRLWRGATPDRVGCVGRRPRPCRHKPSLPLAPLKRQRSRRTPGRADRCEALRPGSPVYAAHEQAARWRLAWCVARPPPAPQRTGPGRRAQPPLADHASNPPALCSNAPTHAARGSSSFTRRKRALRMLDRLLGIAPQPSQRSAQQFTRSGDVGEQTCVTPNCRCSAFTWRWGRGLIKQCFREIELADVQRHQRPREDQPWALAHNLAWHGCQPAPERLAFATLQGLLDVLFDQIGQSTRRHPLPARGASRRRSDCSLCTRSPPYGAIPARAQVRRVAVATARPRRIDGDSDTSDDPQPSARRTDSRAPTPPTWPGRRRAR